MTAEIQALLEQLRQHRDEVRSLLLAQQSERRCPDCNCTAFRPDGSCAACNPPDWSLTIQIGCRVWTAEGPGRVIAFPQRGWTTVELADGSRLRCRTADLMLMA